MLAAASLERNQWWRCAALLAIAALLAVAALLALRALQQRCASPLRSFYGAPWRRVLPDLEETQDVVLVGAGPAGLQWALLLQATRPTASILVLEAGAGPGTFFRTAPWDRRLISINKTGTRPHWSEEFRQRHDWHSLLGAPLLMREVTEEYLPSAEALVQYLEACARGLPIRYDSEVVALGAESSTGLCVLGLSDGVKVRAEQVVLCTGYRPRQPSESITAFAEREGAQLYTYPHLPPKASFRNERVLVVGSGNAALEVAREVSGVTARTVLAGKRPALSCLTHYPGNVRIKNLALYDQYALKSVDVASLDFSGGTHCTGDDLGVIFACSAGDEESARPFDAVVYAGGFTSARGKLVTCGSQDSKFPARAGPFGQDLENPRVWYSGVLTHGLDYQLSAGGFIHGFRYMIRAQLRRMQEMLGEKNGFAQRSYPDLETCVAALVKRLQQSAGLYQMQGVLFDVVWPTEGGHSSWAHVEEVPVAWLKTALPTCAGRACVAVGFAYPEQGKAWDFEELFLSKRIGRFLRPVTRGCGTMDGTLPASTLFWGPEDPSMEWRTETIVRQLTKALRATLEQVKQGS